MPAPMPAPPAATAAAMPPERAPVAPMDCRMAQALPAVTAPPDAAAVDDMNQAAHDPAIMPPSVKPAAAMTGTTAGPAAHAITTPPTTVPPMMNMFWPWPPPAPAGGTSIEADRWGCMRSSVSPCASRLS
eukprot:360996-Chlamydomonas_euryale.AAC.2